MRQGIILLAMAVVALCTTVSKAQVTTATISGTVTDSSGAVLPGAKIVILSEATGVSRTATTDAGGHYSAPSLNVGNYRVTASQEGFQSEVRSGIVLTVGREAVVNLQLQVGAVTQTVEVTGEAPLVQTTDSTISYVVTGGQLGDLPINGRDLSQLILIAPGVNVSTNPGGQAFNGYGKRISIAGMRGEDNTYLLDGGLIGDFRRHIPAGPSGALLGLETVQEFQVLTNSLSAQYGRALGGVFNAVSKSGTNTWHGDAYEYLRNSALDARDFFDRKQSESSPRLPPFRRNQFGATLGGPIQKDQMFFFVAYESTREVKTTTQAPITMDADLRQGIMKSNGVPTGTRVLVAAKMVPYINQYPLPSLQGRAFGDGTAEYIFEYKQPTIEHFGQTRVDFPSLTADDSFFVRFSGSHSGGSTPTGFPDFEQVSSLGSWLLTLSETHIISPTALNTVRFHFSRVFPLDTGNAPPPGPGVLVTPGQPDPPEIAPGSGISSYGGGGFNTKTTIMISNRFTYQDDVHWRIGAHSLQWGGFLERFQLNSNKPNRAWGVWSFSNAQQFLTGVVNTFRGAIPGYGIYQRGFRNWAFALYLQDDWRVNNQLTVNLGVRWEPYTVPTEVNGRIANLRHINDTAGTVGDPYWLNKSWGDIGPRVGLAWSPFASGKTSVRAGLGLLYAPNDPNLYYNQMDRQPPLGYDFTLAVPATASFFPDAFAQVAAQSTLGPAYSVPFDNNKDSQALQYNFNIQQQIGASSVISVGYAGSRGTHLLSVGDLNIPRAEWDGASLFFPTTAQLVNPAWPSILLFANNTSSKYNALIVSYQRRFAKGLQAQVSYTWSKSLAGADSGQTGGGVTSGGGRQKYPYDTRAQWGSSGYDFRNVLTFNYTYDLPFGRGVGGVAGKLLTGWQTSGVLNFRSGQPLNLTAAVPNALSALAVNPRSPNAVAGYSRDKIILGGPDKYYDVNAYSPPGPRQLGNLGRNTMMGPGSITWNPAVFKKIPVSEPLTLEFRTEMFNVLNRPNFGTPANQVFTGTGGPVASSGSISSTANSSRQIQFALKLLW